MPKNTAWSNEEVKFLENHYLDMTTGEISQALGRSRYAVYQKLRLLGLFVNLRDKKNYSKISFKVNESSIDNDPNS